MISTKRLDLIPATRDLTRAALDDVPRLGSMLQAVVPPTWPPHLLDRPPLEFTLRKLEQGPEEGGWWLYFVVLRAPARTLIGSAGYKGRPDDDGTVELGYGIVADHQRRGYASEATHGLLAHAFAVPTVRRVIAETLPDLAPSIGVMTKCGFHFIGDGSEPGVIRYEITRGEWQGSSGQSPP